jgi:hypothetical protein
MIVMSIGALISTPARLSNASWAMFPLLTDNRVVPLLSRLISLVTKRRKIDTRTSTGIAKGILLSTPRRGDGATWHVERGPESFNCWCCCASSKLHKASEHKKTARCAEIRTRLLRQKTACPSASSQANDLAA